MPMFDFECRECGARTEDHIVHSGPQGLPRGLPCPCGSLQVRLAGNFAIWGPMESRPPIDDPKEIFHGIEGLEDTDGVNQTYYRSKKTTIELGSE